MTTTFRKYTPPPIPRPTEADPLPGLRGSPPRISFSPVRGGPFTNILVRGPNWVGDVVMALPAFRCLRESFPRARITLQIKPRLAPILSGEPWFDEIIPYTAKGFREMWRAGRDLAARGFDLALIFPNSVSSALVTTVAGIPRRVGYDLEGRDKMQLLTHTIRSRKVEGLRLTPMVDHYLALAYMVGGRPSSRRVEFRLTGDLRRRAEEFFRRAGVGEGDRVIGINPGAAFGRSKQWPAASFAAVADALAREHGARILIFCGPEEEEVADEIEAAMETPAISTSREIIPLDLLKSVMARCGLLVSTDSGMRHFAVGADVPLVVVLGPTTYVYTEMEYEKYDLVQHKLDCWPCHQPECPLGHHRCMKDLTPERVLEACRGVLRRFPPGA